jgi:glycosyltransferase involved in cell wall biosynthesis
LASGAFITFLDADDFWLPDFLVRTVAFLEGNTEAIGVTCSYRLSRESDETFPQLDENDLDPPTRILKNFFEFWGKYDHVRTGTCLMRKSIVDQTEGQLADLRISQDLEYWAYFATFGKMGFIRDAMWVGNSRRNAAKSGWWRKYKKRRRMCPTVEQWLRRVESRLAENQRWGFEKVKGRVAMNYIHSMILAGRFKDARDQFREHGASLPTTIVWRIVSFSNRLGPVGWHLGCLGLQMRERGKTIRLALRNRKI